MSWLSIRAKLFVAFALVVLIGVGAVALISYRQTNADFRSYMAASGPLHLRTSASSLAEWYDATGSWDGVDTYLRQLQRTDDDHLVLTSGGVVIADNRREWTGQTVSGLGLPGGVAIVSRATEVGRLYLVGTDASSIGRYGMMMGMGPPTRGRTNRGAGPDPASVQSSTTPTAETSYLAAVSQSLGQATLIALFAALVLSWLLTRQVTVPLRVLADGARRIAAGNLDHRVPVKSRDEIGQVAATFNDMAAELQRQERARRNLLADVAHELRTPLTVIEGTADAILDGVYEPTPDVIRALRDEARTLSKLVADLRILSLADAGQLKLALEVTDPVELARRSVQAADPVAIERQVTLSVEAAADLPLCLADPQRMSQVLGNLLSNALRHTPAEGTVKVRVATDEGARNLLIEVADSGEGIAPEDLPYVFDRFFRADRSRARSSGGSGLGLAISKQIVEQHGGRIWVESEPGHGARFFASLPVLKEPRTLGDHDQG